VGSGEHGPRPEPTAATIERQIEQRTADRDALDKARDVALAAKVAYIERHRGRLLRDAARARAAARARYVDAIQAASDARAELMAARESEVWARLYPNELASAQPSDLIVDGLRKPQTDAIPGLTFQVAPHSLWRLLQADADYLASACTPDQQRLLTGDDGAVREGTHWGGSVAEAKFEQQQRKAALDRVAAGTATRWER
jgi:hypothetical protein